MWKGRYRCAVTLSVDFDAESLWSGTFKLATPSPLSRGDYDVRAALPRIHALLDAHELPATFMVPAQVAEEHADACAEIAARGRHEVGYHGYFHESVLELPIEEERELMKRGIDRLEETFDSTPRGNRSPPFALGPNTADLLEEFGFAYDSSLFGHDEPYRPRVPIEGGPLRDFVELPVSWELDDAPYFLFSFFPYMSGLSTPSQVAVLLAACSSTSGGSSSSSVSGSTSSQPIVIGISLSQTGDFSDPGKAAMRGYQLWAETVNANGGILGRQVQLKIADDASDPGQAVTNYETFITKDHVDLVFGPFSTLLSVPSAQIANRYGYSFVEPAGGGPDIFAAKLPNVFFVQPAPVLACGDPFVNWILSLPADQRPKTAAYVSLDDPFASPIADAMQAKFEAAGIQTVAKTIYPPETTNFTPIVSPVAAKNPDMWVGGTQSDDAYAQVKSMISLNFNPKFLYLSNGASSPVEFPSKVGANNVNGIFSCGDWFPNSNASGNQDFINAYTTKYGGDAFGIDSTSAEAYAVGQLIQAVATKTGSIDNQTIINTLHSGTWPTVEGNLSWDQYGMPQGSDMLVEWIDQKLTPVYPADVALHAPVSPKPNWGG